MYLNKSSLMLMNSTLHIISPHFIFSFTYVCLYLSILESMHRVSRTPLLVERSKILHPQGPIRASKNLPFLLHPYYFTEHFVSIFIICRDHWFFLQLTLHSWHHKKVPQNHHSKGKPWVYNSMRKIHNFLTGTH